MSTKKKRKRKPKLAKVVTNIAPIPVEEKLVDVTETPAPAVDEQEPTTPTLEPIVTKPSDIETLLLKAPVLPWKIDTTYIDTDFRKAYIALLKLIVKTCDLPYNVNQTGTLTPR